MSPERFGRYLLLDQIGRGGMAEVYRAIAQGLEGFRRIFVIKRILRDRSASPEFVDMFVNEARISALLNHPNIVQIYDFGQIEGHYFLAMEYLRGRDLLSVLRALRAHGKQMPPEVAAYIAQQVALGLHYAHHLTQGGKCVEIVHRDVSPSNIMLLRAGGVKLLDFGIAKAAMEIRTDAHTQTGLVKGKLSYVAPEQIKGFAVDGRSDVFALGVVLWESLTGKRLFFDRNDFQTMKNVVERPVPPPSTQRADVPTALDFIVLRALERDVNRRYPDAKTMADELETVLQDARFAPGAMVRLMDDLFGAESDDVDLLPDAPGDSRETGRQTTPTRDDAAPLLSSEGPYLPDQEESYAGVSSIHRIAAVAPRRRAVWLAAAAVAVLAAGSGLALRTRGTSEPVARASAATARAEETAPPAPVMNPTRAMVSVRIDSDPAGAEVRDGEGLLRGQTPVVLTVMRGAEPLVVTVKKSGFLPRTQTIVPDGDVSAVVTLAREEAGRRVKGTPSPRRPRGDGRVLEGLSVDPFAEPR